MTLSNDDLPIAAQLLSPDRLARFMDIGGTERDAIELHQRSMDIAAALMPIVGTIEIALRNAISERLRTLFGTPDWLNSPPSPFQWKDEERDHIAKAVRLAQRAAYAKLGAAEKAALDALAFPQGVPATTTHEQRSKKRQREISVSVGQVIAQLTIYFWKRLLSDDYEQALWKRDLRKLFPNKSLERGVIARHLEVIYQARNRIAHHEPIYGQRLVTLQASVDFIGRNFMTKAPTEEAPLMKLTAGQRERLRLAALEFDEYVARLTMAQAPA